jgi:GGDEF domain-containing protein
VQRAPAIKRLCAEPSLIEGTTVTVGTSVGAAVSPDDATDAEALVRFADRRMYEAKASALTHVE